MKRILLILAFSCASLYVLAQNHQPCATSEYIAHINEQVPGFQQNVNDNYLKAVKATQQNIKSLGKANPIDTTFTIQVVFHVVYNTDEQNISDNHIIEQLKVLNDAFNRENADTADTREIFKPVAGNARIRFELASIDPNGDSTSGITRKKTNFTTFNSGGAASTTDYVKNGITGGVSSWNTDKYLNVWVCNLNIGNTRALFGYAFPPTDADFWDARYFVEKQKQGVVLHYETVGPNNPADLDESQYTNEKTAIHEFGHYFGLRHTWGDSRFAGCSVDDFIEDTPITRAASRGCTIGANTCTADTFPDQIENYMDYSGAACTNMFTKQQVDVMRYNLVNLRPGLGAMEIEYEPEPTPAYIDLALYPNPVNGYLDFVSTKFDQDVQLKITNYLGQEVLTQTKFKSGNVLRFDLLDIANGYYWVEFTTGDELLIKQAMLFMKQ